MSSNSKYSAAALDIWQSIKKPRLWAYLGFRDIKVLYERSFIGPFWMTLQAAAWVGAIIFVFSGLMGEPEAYAIYVAIGIVLYNFITAIITNSSEVFIANRILIHSHPNPYFSYVLRQVMTALIQLAFQSLVVIIIFFAFKYPITPIVWLAIPGLFLGVLTSIGVALLFSLLGLRIGDFRFATLAVMRLMLFVTPILWTTENTGPIHKFVALINPFAHFIDIVRMPLMGQTPPVISYIVTIGCLLFAVVTGLFLFIKMRRTIPMWV